MVERVAVLSVHTSPLAQPGTGDAGGMNVYVLKSAMELAARGVQVEIFTRATSSHDEPVVRVADGVVVRNIVAGPFEGLRKSDLPTQLCAFTAGVLRTEAHHPVGYYDVIHSHYWLSGQVGWLARDRWGVPLVHTAHTLAAVKNISLAQGDIPEPHLRQVGEQQVVDEADRLIVNTAIEARELEMHHGADISRIDVVSPGADLEIYKPGDRAAARVRLGLNTEGQYIGFVGRVQPLKAPDVLLKAAAPVIRSMRSQGRRLSVVMVGGPSGTGLEKPRALIDLAFSLGIADDVVFMPPQPPERLVDVYRAVDLIAVPSYSESFGLVAIEAQASGTPVIAADVGGLGIAVDYGVTGELIAGHSITLWTERLQSLLDETARLKAMAAAAPLHAQRFSWGNTADGLIRSYELARESFAGTSRRRLTHNAATMTTGKSDDPRDTRAPWGRWRRKVGTT